MKQWLKDFTHNCIVHPMMMFMPKKWAHELHDRHADWAFGLNRYDELALENIKNKSTTKVLVLLDQYETTK